MQVLALVVDWAVGRLIAFFVAPAVNAHQAAIAVRVQHAAVSQRCENHLRVAARAEAEEECNGDGWLSQLQHGAPSFEQAP